MRGWHRQSGWLPSVIVLAALAAAPAAARADSPLDDSTPLAGSLDSEAGSSWAPGPVIGAVDDVPPAWEDESEHEFLWAGDRAFGLLMSFDPDDEELIFGWEIDF